MSPPNPEATGGFFGSIRNQATNLFSQLNPTSDPAVELHSQSNSTSDLAEELHSQLSTSDNPLWDFVVLRKKQIQQSGIRLEGNMELALLVKVEDSLWSGDFLGGDHPVKEYLLNVDSPEILPETRDALKLKVILEEKAQRDQPGRYYLKWLQARCLRETRFATTSSQSYPTTLAQIDETLQQIPVDRVTRISDPNDPAHLFCRAHRMRLKAAKDKRCKPELDHLEQLLKIELIRLRERVPPCCLGLAAGFKLASALKGYKSQGIQSLFSGGCAFTLAKASVASWRKANEARRGERSISNLEALCLAFAAAAGVSSAGVRMSDSGQETAGLIAALVLDIALQLGLLGWF